MIKIYAAIVFAMAVGCSVTSPEEETEVTQTASDTAVSVPEELALPHDSACRRACFGRWDCGSPCGFCTAPNTGGRGICITAEAIKPGDVILE